jgi:GTP pyrophosphokinase
LANTAHTSQADLNKSHRSFLLPVDQENSSLTQLIKTYLPKREVDKVWEAYRFSEKAHSGQKRKSGEAYISHPVSVACIAARFHLDSQSIQAALLHDVVEDTEYTELEIESKFGKQVSKLVTGLSKLDKVEFQDANEAQAENFRKM